MRKKTTTSQKLQICISKVGPWILSWAAKKLSHLRSIFTGFTSAYLSSGRTVRWWLLWQFCFCFLNLDLWTQFQSGYWKINGVQAAICLPNTTYRALLIFSLRLMNQYLQKWKEHTNLFSKTMKKGCLTSGGKRKKKCRARNIILSFCEDITRNISKTKNNLTIEPGIKKD